MVGRMTSALLARAATVGLLLACAHASAQDPAAGEAPAAGVPTVQVPADVAPAAIVSRTPRGTMGKGSRNALRVNLSEAQRRLVQAQEKRSLGIEPLPGERYTLDGAERVTHRYWRRQESLRQQVELAQQRLNAIREPLLARR